MVMNRLRPAALVLAVLATCGCGSKPELPHTKLGSFKMIEGSVNDIVSSIMSPTYKQTSRDLGTDSDRIGLALMTFTKEAEGTPLAAEAKDIKTKFEALEQLTAKRAPVDKQREAAKTLQDAVSAMKAKL